MQEAQMYANRETDPLSALRQYVREDGVATKLIGMAYMSESVKKKTFPLHPPETAPADEAVTGGTP
jgi:hypothetical protein